MFKLFYKVEKIQKLLITEWINESDEIFVM